MSFFYLFFANLLPKWLQRMWKLCKDTFVLPNLEFCFFRTKQNKSFFGLLVKSHLFSFANHGRLKTCSSSTRRLHSIAHYTSFSACCDVLIRTFHLVWSFQTITVGSAQPQHFEIESENIFGQSKFEQRPKRCRLSRFDAFQPHRSFTIYQPHYSSTYLLCRPIRIGHDSARPINRTTYL